MQISPVTVVTLFAKNGILLGAVHRVLGDNAKSTDYTISQHDIDALGKELDRLHQNAGRLLTPEADEPDLLADVFGSVVTPITQEDRIKRHQQECRNLDAATDDLRALYKLCGLYAPSTWMD